MDEIPKMGGDKYRNIFNGMEQGFCLIEMVAGENGMVQDYKFLETNTAFEKQTGLYNAVGKTMKQLQPAHEQGWFEIYGRIAKSGKPQHFEMEAAFLTPLGMETGAWYDVFAAPFGDINSMQLAVLLNDITAQKLLDEQQRFRLRLSEAIRTGTDAVAIEDAVARVGIDYFNTERCYYCTVVGDLVTVKRDAWKGNLPSVSGTYPLESFTIYKNIVAEGKPFIINDIYTTDLMHEGLKAICIQLKIISFINVPVVKSGKVIGIFCLVQSTPRNWLKREVDLATETAERMWAAVERANAEEALNIREKQLNRVQEISNVGGLDIIIDDELAGWHSAQYLKVHGLPPLTIETHKDWFERLHPADREQAEAALQQALESRADTYQGEYRIIRPNDGEERWIFAKLDIERNNAGKAIRLIGAHTDITERKKIELRLKNFNAVLEEAVAQTSEIKEAAKKLQENNKELLHTIGQLESFNYVASHDLQEPLRKIQMLSNLIAQRDAQTLSESSKIYFTHLNTAARQMQELVTDLLSYSQSNAAKDAFSLNDLNLLLIEVKSQLSEAIASTHTKIESDILPEVWVIPFQVKQVFANLISNSIKFARRGVPPEIKIWVNQVSAAQMPANGNWNYETYYHIAIRDNGIGFNAEFNEQVFGLFKRLHEKSEYPGTGIGLAIVKKIITNHEGLVTAEGKKGEGATVHLYFPKR